MRIKIPIPPYSVTAQMAQRYRISRGKLMGYKDKRYKDAERAMIAHLSEHRPIEPLSGPLHAEIVLVFPFKKSETQARKRLGSVPHDKRPDLDNLSKLYCDVLVKAGIITDDGAISDLVLRKRWQEVPFIYYEIEQI